MRVYQYWAKVTEVLEIQNVEKPLPVTCFGGSNESMASAEAAAKEKIQIVIDRIKGQRRSESYEVEIREELIEKIDSKNAITRNRYGALVLNSEDTVFIDIDRPKMGIFGWFRKLSKQARKDKIFKQIENTAALKAFSDLSIRVYETPNGYRLIIANQNLLPTDPLVQRLFKKFNCDPIYATLCRKQNCFRARLTPKPYNMKHKKIQVKFPRETSEEATFNQWLQSYNNAAAGFAGCRYIRSIGPSSEPSKIIRIHDEKSGAKLEDRRLG